MTPLGQLTLWTFAEAETFTHPVPGMFVDCFRVMVRLRLRVSVRLRLGEGVGGLVLVATPDSVRSTWLRLRLRLRLGGGVVGSVLVADLGLGLHLGLGWEEDQFQSPNQTQYIVYVSSSSFLMPQHHIHIPPIPLLFRRYKPTKSELKGRLAM